jgi:phosphatidate cytidylyltransferase
MTDTPTQPATTPRGDLLPRVISSVILAPIALIAVWFGGWPLMILGVAASIVLLLEWLHVTGQDWRTPIGIGSVIAVAITVLVASAWLVPVAIAIAAIAAVVILALVRRGWVALGLIYAPLMAVSLLALRPDPAFGLAAVFFVLAVVWATDIGAYAAGRTLGGPKLWPAVSPKKTWSGFGGGLIAALIAGIVVALIAEAKPGLTVAVLSVVLSLACQAGDLFESAVKRRFGVKDASHLIPGHGGLMDRVDGLTFAAPLAALIGYIHGGAGHIGEGLLVW